MNTDKCPYAERLLKLLRAGDRDREISDHARHCPQCSRILTTHAAMMEMAKNTAHNEEDAPPPFESLWRKAFPREGISPEKIARAMLPVRIAGTVAALVSLAVGIFLLAAVGPGLLDYAAKAGIWEIFNIGLFDPLIRIFKSSYFVSIPMSLVLLSFPAYFLAMLIKPLIRRPLRTP